MHFVRLVLGLATALLAAQGKSQVAANTQTVSWSSCGEGLSSSFQCTNISVPLDYGNRSDSRTISLAVTRFLGSDQPNRQGAIFVNPGGPGGSGTEYVRLIGPTLNDVLQGKYDLIGWDPRGVRLSKPYVSCFKTQFDAEVFTTLSNNFMLNLPANSSISGLRTNVERQVNSMSTYMTSLARRCVSRSGAILPYLGTAFVVKDIDFLSRLIEGEHTPVNFWGQSYGTLIGQYMVKILAPERLGRIVLDGVLNPDLWQGLAINFFDQGQEDDDKVLEIFASSCVAAGSNCSLNAEFNFKSGDALLAKIDSTINALYFQGVPVDSEVGAIATAANLRALLINAAYSIQLWPTAAQILSSAFKGNFTDLVTFTMPVIQPTDAQNADGSMFAGGPIACADTKAYSTRHPPPTNSEITDLVLRSQTKYSRRIGERLWYISLCHLWEREGVSPERSRYGGNFALANNTLKTPVLILSQTYDPVTPLSNAKLASQRWGNNARLIQQTDGVGHTASGQPSSCTAAATQAYFLNGTIPTAKVSQCPVDVQPWMPAPMIEGLQQRDENSILRNAWLDLSRKRPRSMAWGV